MGLRFEKGYPELANGKSGLRKAIPNAGTWANLSLSDEWAQADSQGLIRRVSAKQHN